MSVHLDRLYEELKLLFRNYDVRYNEEKYRLKNLTPDIPFRRASVLIPLFYKNGQLQVLLTIRSKGMHSFTGQVAFPGGMSDPRDLDAIATALREAHEEVGLVENEVKVIAVLPQTALRPDIIVTPVLALIPSDFRPTMDTKEVENVFDLPLNRFLSSRRRTHEYYFLEDGTKFIMFHFLETIGNSSVDIWGMTASLCLQVAMVTYQSDTVLPLYANKNISLENCFTTEATQFVIDYIVYKAKL